MNWLLELLKKTWHFLIGTSGKPNFRTEKKHQISNNLSASTVSEKNKKNEYKQKSSEQNSQPNSIENSKKSTKKPNPQNDKPTDIRPGEKPGQKTSTSSPQPNGSLNTDKVGKLRISDKRIYISLTGSINDQYLKIWRLVNYQPNNKFKQYTPRTFPIVLMPLEKTVIKPPINGKCNNKGMTEESFCRDFLMKYFKNQIYDSLTLFVGSTPYEPDLTFIDLDSGKNIFIDIEIDEPYDGITRKPTHYRTAYGTSDDARNNGFLDRGWMVIRFAEEQIVTRPIECVKFIGLVIKSINSEFHSICLNLPGELNSVPIWSEDDAKRYAFENKREKYLGISEFFPSTTRDYSIKDSILGKEIEESIKAKKAEGNNKNEKPSSDRKIENQKTDSKEANVKQTFAVTSVLTAPIITPSTPKQEEPKITTKTDKPSQPSPKPYANIF